MTWMYWLGSGIIATVAVMGWSSCRTAGRGDEWDRMVACVRDFGHVAGSDDYWWDLACPGAMTAEQLDEIVRGAETVEIAGRYRLLYEFQLGRVDGWKSAAASDIEDTDIEREFRVWESERGQEAA